MKRWSQERRPELISASAVFSFELREAFDAHEDKAEAGFRL